jgi:hypothetical protein
MYMLRTRKRRICRVTAEVGLPRLAVKRFCRSGGAPGRIRTRDPLLRRQLLCPAELRAPGCNSARRRSHNGYTKVAVCPACPEDAGPHVRQQAIVPKLITHDARNISGQASTARSQ